MDRSDINAHIVSRNINTPFHMLSCCGVVIVGWLHMSKAGPNMQANSTVASKTRLVPHDFTKCTININIWKLTLDGKAVPLFFGCLPWW